MSRSDQYMCRTVHPKIHYLKLQIAYLSKTPLDELFQGILPAGVENQKWDLLYDLLFHQVSGHPNPEQKVNVKCKATLLFNVAIVR